MGGRVCACVCACVYVHEFLRWVGVTVCDRERESVSACVYCDASIIKLCTIHVTCYVHV